MPRRLLSRMFQAIACAALLALGACTGQDTTASLSLEQTVARPRLAALARQPKAPRAALPASDGAVTEVRDVAYADGFRQDVFLAGSVGAVRNSITILGRTPGSASLDPMGPLAPPTQSSIAAEIARQFPGIAMEVVTRPATNAYGPYGFALGRGAGDVHCLYAWQWIDEPRALTYSGMTGPVSLRIRLCRPDQTFDALAASVDRLGLGDNAAPALGSGSDQALAGPEAVVALVEPPAQKHADRKPRRHRITARHPRPTSAPVVAQDVAPAPATQAIAEAPIRAMPASVATDLPPQAYLGPTSSKP